MTIFEEATKGKEAQRTSWVPVPIISIYAPSKLETRAISGPAPSTPPPRGATSISYARNEAAGGVDGKYAKDVGNKYTTTTEVKLISDTRLSQFKKVFQPERELC